MVVFLSEVVWAKILSTISLDAFAHGMKKRLRNAILIFMACCMLIGFAGFAVRPCLDNSCTVV